MTDVADEVVEVESNREFDHSHEHTHDNGGVVLSHAHTHIHFRKASREGPAAPPDGSHEQTSPHQSDATSADVRVTRRKKIIQNLKAILKFAVIRVAMRVAMVAAVAVALWKIPWPFSWTELLKSYCAWARGFGVILGPVLFLLVACLWTSFSPTGYLPAVLAGLTFGIYEGSVVAWVAVNVGGVINMVVVRSALRLRKRCPGAMSRASQGRLGRVLRWLKRVLIGGRKIDAFTKLAGDMLRQKPFLAVLLLRLPYMGNGAVNYVLSISPVSWLYAAGANLIGFIPGSILFATLGTQATSLLDVLFKGFSRERIPSVIVFVSVFVLTGLSVVLLGLLARRVFQKSKRERELLIKMDHLQDFEHNHAHTSCDLPSEDSSKVVGGLASSSYSDLPLISGMPRSPDLDRAPDAGLSREPKHEMT